MCGDPELEPRVSQMTKVLIRVGNNLGRRDGNALKHQIFSGVRVTDQCESEPLNGCPVCRAPNTVVRLCSGNDQSASVQALQLGQECGVGEGIPVSLVHDKVPGPKIQVLFQLPFGAVPLHLRFFVLDEYHRHTRGAGPGDQGPYPRKYAFPIKTGGHYAALNVDDQQCCSGSVAHETSIPPRRRGASVCATRQHSCSVGLWWRPPSYAKDMSELITNIGELMTQDNALGTLRDAAVLLVGERIAWIGPSADAPDADRVTDAQGRAVLPGWVDSHTHLVFAGDRTAEFEARMAGESYSAGGIAVSVAATRAASDYELTRLGLGRVAEALSQGTTYLETKTGYGLNVEQEARSARIAAGIADEVTYLGAHLVPVGADPEEYTELVCGPMLDAVRPYVSWADVFCETGAFTSTQSRRVLEACRDAGLGLRVHGNQLGHGDGVALAVELGAASVDHVNYLNDDDVSRLARSWAAWEAGQGSGDRGTVATVLPACDLSTRQPLAPARALLDAGAQIAIASNANPGTSYTSSMAFCVTTAVLQMGLSVHEAVRAATYGGALALHRERGRDADGERAVGSIAVGHRADLHMLKAPSATHLAYRPGIPLTHAVWRAGVRAV